MEKLRILVVDDDPRYLELLEFTLQGEGFDVFTAQKPSDVQQLAVTLQPDVILTDVSMPGMDGYALAAGLRGDPRTGHIPLIFVTAHTENGAQQLEMNLKDADHLTKPFSVLDLVSRIRRLTDDVSEEGKV